MHVRRCYEGPNRDHLEQRLAVVVNERDALAAALQAERERSATLLAEVHRLRTLQETT